MSSYGEFDDLPTRLKRVLRASLPEASVSEADLIGIVQYTSQKAGGLAIARYLIPVCCRLYRLRTASEAQAILVHTILKAVREVEDSGDKTKQTPAKSQTPLERWNSLVLEKTDFTPSDVVEEAAGEHYDVLSDKQDSKKIDTSIMVLIDDLGRIVPVRATYPLENPRRGYVGIKMYVKERDGESHETVMGLISGG